MAQKTDADWKTTLTPEQFHVLREHGTEHRGSSPLNHEKRSGVFKCAGCGRPLFSSDTKYESGTGPCHRGSFGSKSSATPFMQYRSPAGAGPSGNT